MTEKHLWELSSRLYAQLCVLRFQGYWDKASNLATRWLVWAARQSFAAKEIES
jgi:hypothetical protein